MCNLALIIKSQKGKFMKNPIEAIVEWISDTPQEYQADIAFVVGYAMPGLPDDILHDSDKLVENFIACIKKYHSGGHKDVGFVVSFKATVEHLLIRKRSQQQHWEKTILEQEEMLQDEEIQSNERMKQLIMGMLEKLPQRQEDWIQICARWNEMVSNALDDNNLDLWHRSQMKPIEQKPVIISSLPA